MRKDLDKLDAARLSFPWRKMRNCKSELRHLASKRKLIDYEKRAKEELIDYKKRAKKEL
jgi:hypothetical protein